MRAFDEIAQVTQILASDPPPGVTRLLDGDSTWLTMRYRLALYTGWALEYIDDLEMDDAYGLLGLIAGLNRARQ